MWTKMCPKCGGDLYLRTDISLEEITCIQCGLILSPRQETELLLKLQQRRERNEQQHSISINMVIGLHNGHHQ